MMEYPFYTSNSNHSRPIQPELKKILSITKHRFDIVVNGNVLYLLASGIRFPWSPNLIEDINILKNIYLYTDRGINLEYNLNSDGDQLGFLLDCFYLMYHNVTFYAYGNNQLLCDNIFFDLIMRIFQLRRRYRYLANIIYSFYSILEYKNSEIIRRLDNKVLFLTIQKMLNLRKYKKPRYIYKSLDNNSIYRHKTYNDIYDIVYSYKNNRMINPLVVEYDNRFINMIPFEMCFLGKTNEKQNNGRIMKCIRDDSMYKLIKGYLKYMCYMDTLRNKIYNNIYNQDCVLI